METKDIHSHCPEVEGLMGGKMPFVTRHGITIVALVLVAVVILLLLTKGTSQQLMMEMLEHTMEQIKSKI